MHPKLTVVIASKAAPSKTLRMIFSEIDEPSLGSGTTVQEQTIREQTFPTTARTATLVRNPACYTFTMSSEREERRVCILQRLWPPFIERMNGA